MTGPTMETASHPLAHPVTQLEIDQRVFDLYDEYCHGGIDRREFLRRASLVMGGLAMAQALLPRYARAQTVSFTVPCSTLKARKSRRTIATGSPSRVIAGRSHQRRNDSGACAIHT